MKSISRRSFVAAGAGAVALGLAACGNSGNSATTSTADGEKSYKIGVLQLTQHAALDAANEGFVAALDASGINYTIDQQNANNDQSACSTIASSSAAPSPTTPLPASSLTTRSPAATSPAPPT